MNIKRPKTMKPSNPDYPKNPTHLKNPDLTTKPTHQARLDLGKLLMISMKKPEKPQI